MSRLYGYLLRLYPRRFRDAYGSAMLQLFQDRLRDEGSWPVWRDVASDLLTSLPREYWRVHPRALSIAGATLALVSFGLWMGFSRGPRLAYLPLVEMPSVIGGWTQEYDAPVGESTLETLGTRDVLNRIYTGERQQVSLFVARWGTNRFVPSRRESETDGWQTDQEETTVIPIGGGTPIRATQVRMEKGQDAALVLWWYHRKQTTSRDVLWGTLLRQVGIAAHAADSAVVRVIITGHETDQRDQAAVENFVQAIYPELAKRL